jgi:hypothetical protein
MVPMLLLLLLAAAAAAAATGSASCGLLSCCAAVRLLLLGVAGAPEQLVGRQLQVTTGGETQNMMRVDDQGL